ncbi:hypothetical protein Vadar_014691 [Vaccinium darrowii]|uniref:Uncharacterized protein n=1 Tax=Vaccinium darrowii TaxID=229202 RepID=A0ACB7XHG8_9ERIC|nr:hypothetical protein Vadar_014691 [Vaccinium darrowii]
MGAENSMKHMLKQLMETEGEMGPKEWFNYLVEKLKEWLKKLDEVFPPETRGEDLKHWLIVAAPFIIAAVVLIACLWCCCRCCCRGGGRGRAVRMMKAPGRDYRMPRHVFEENPRSYFRNLRGKTSIDELV